MTSVWHEDTVLGLISTTGVGCGEDACQHVVTNVERGSHDAFLRMMIDNTWASPLQATRTSRYVSFRPKLGTHLLITGMNRKGRSVTMLMLCERGFHSMHTANTPGREPLSSTVLKCAVPLPSSPILLDYTEEYVQCERSGNDSGLKR